MGSRKKVVGLDYIVACILSGDEPIREAVIKKVAKAFEAAAEMLLGGEYDLRVPCIGRLGTGKVDTSQLAQKRKHPEVEGDAQLRVTACSRFLQCAETGGTIKVEAITPENFDKEAGHPRYKVTEPEAPKPKRKPKPKPKRKAKPKLKTPSKPTAPPGYTVIELPGGVVLHFPSKPEEAPDT